MTNLSQKFNDTKAKIDNSTEQILSSIQGLKDDQAATAVSLSQQLAIQHNDLMQKLDQTNIKLDALLTALGAPPPTPTTTLADIAAILNAIHLDTISLDQKLLRIRNSIAPLTEAQPAETQESIHWLLYRLMDAINPTWPRPDGTALLPATQQMLAVLVPELADGLQLLTQIRQALGSPTGDATSTALGLLASIQFASSGTHAAIGPISGGGQTVRELLAAQADAGGCGCTTAPPPVGSCDDLYVSSNMQFVPTSLIPGLTSVAYALWPEPAPAGLQFGTIFGTGEPDNSTIRPAFGNSWTGYRLFVRSSAPSYSTDFTSPARYPTGEWRDLSGVAEIGVIVPGGESVEAYLCLRPVLIDNCIEISSQLVTIGPRDGTKGAAHMAGPPPGFSGANSVFLVPFPPAYTLGSNVVWQGNFNGWSFETLTGTEAVLVAAQPSDGTNSIILIVPPGEVREITEPTSSVWITRSVLAGAPDGAFTIKACPPGAGGPA